MHRVGKPGEENPLEHHSGPNDHKEFNNERRDVADLPLSRVVTAIAQLERDRRRDTMFEGRFPVDQGWRIMLLVYLYQASGTPITLELLPHEADLPEGTAYRYVEAMRRDALIEADAITLSRAGRSKIEALLSFANEKDA